MNDFGQSSKIYITTTFAYWAFFQIFKPYNQENKASDNQRKRLKIFLSHICIWDWMRHYLENNLAWYF
jgi:hypothetical protein